MVQVHCWAPCSSLKQEDEDREVWICSCIEGSCSPCSRPSSAPAGTGSPSVLLPHTHIAYRTGKVQDPHAGEHKTNFLWPLFMPSSQKAASQMFFPSHTALSEAPSYCLSQQTGGVSLGHWPLSSLKKSSSTHPVQLLTLQHQHGCTTSLHVHLCLVYNQPEMQAILEIKKSLLLVMLYEAGKTQLYFQSTASANNAGNQKTDLMYFAIWVKMTWKISNEK